MSQPPNDSFSQLFQQAAMARQSYKRSLRAREVIVVNYLAFLVFLAMMGIGYFIFGRNVDPNHISASFVLTSFGWFIVSAYVSSAVKIAAQWEKALIFRLGRFSAIKGPGVYLIFPMIDQVQTLDTRILTMDIPRQEAITKDNVPISIDGVIFMQVVRPDQAIINVQDYAFAITQYAQTALRDVIGGRTLDEVLSDREAIGHSIEKLVEDETQHWGLEVAGIRIQDNPLPGDLKDSMSR